MKEYKTELLRNVALIGHGSSGKTTLAEAMLAAGKAIPKMGTVETGSTVMDWDAFEIERKSTINLSVAGLAFRDVKINIVDTPGFPDFIGDVAGALSVCENAVSVVCATSGIQVQTLQTLHYADLSKSSRIVFVNKMDRENANFSKVLDDLRHKLGSDKVAAVTIPVGSQAAFKGVVNLVTNSAEIDGKKSDIPADLKDEAALLRAALLENIAGSSETLMNKYLESGDLSQPEIEAGLKSAIADGSLIPVLCGCATKGIGVQHLLDLLAASAPAPKADPAKAASAVVFKTIIDPFIGKMAYFKVLSGSFTPEGSFKNHRTDTLEKGKIQHIFGKKLDDNPKAIAGDIASYVKVDTLRAGDILGEKRELVIPYPVPCHGVAIEVDVKGTEDKLAIGLSKLVDDDPVMFMKRDAETHQTIVFGVGETQITLMRKKLEHDYKVKIHDVELMVPYRETIQRKGHGDYRHKKQSGGAGQFAHVVLDVEPLPRGGKYEFVNAVVGGAIPKNFIPAVEKGVIDAMVKGSLAGFPVVDVKTSVVDGKDHPVDSNEMAFKTAGRGAFQQAQSAASPVLLEPIYELKIFTPDEFMGAVNGDMSHRRGRVEGMESLGNGMTVIKAHVPYSEVLRYTIDLKALTQGRGTFEMKFSNHELVPAQQAAKIIEKYGKKTAAAEE